MTESNRGEGNLCWPLDDSAHARVIRRSTSTRLGTSRWYPRVMANVPNFSPALVIWACCWPGGKGYGMRTRFTETGWKLAHPVPSPTHLSAQRFAGGLCSSFFLLHQEDTLAFSWCIRSRSSATLPWRRRPRPLSKSPSFWPSQILRPEERTFPTTLVRTRRSLVHSGQIFNVSCAVSWRLAQW